MANLVKRRVHLYGELAEQIGPHFDLAVRSPAEAVRLLEANFPGKFLHMLHDRSFHVVVGDYNEETNEGTSISEEMTTFKFSSGDFHFIPVMQGAGGQKGKGILMVIIGVALIATAFIGAAFFAGASSIGAGMGASVFGGGLLGGVTWGNIALFGVAIALSGVATLPTPTPKDNKTNTDGDSRKQSFFFNGAVNITEEGTAVPLLFGRLKAGSVVASGGIYSEKLDPYSVAPVAAPKTSLQEILNTTFGT